MASDSNRGGITIVKSDQVRSGYCLTTDLVVAEPLERVFAFFSDAFQLEKLTPGRLRFSVRTSRPIEMHAGTLIDYQLRLYGVPVRWRSKISRWDPPHCFADEQVVGPYRYWHHLHSFEEVAAGTRIHDVVHYAVPLGWILHPLLVRPDLLKIFAFRRQAMSQVFTVVG